MPIRVIAQIAIACALAVPMMSTAASARRGSDSFGSFFGPGVIMRPWHWVVRDMSRFILDDMRILCGPSQDCDTSPEMGYCPSLFIYAVLIDGANQSRGWIHIPVTRTGGWVEPAKTLFMAWVSSWFFVAANLD
ncbi:MAG: hypothetical protein WAT09_07635 [Paracoccaceae bacterium]